jgi:hypothetical protein
MAKRHFQKIILKENGLPPMEIRLPPSVIVGDSRTQMSGYMAEPFTPVATELNTPFATEPNTPAECMAHGAGDLSHAADPVALAAALESVNLAPRVEAVGEDIGGVAEVSEPITEAPASNSLATWATSGLTAGLPRTPLRPAFARVFGGSSPLTPLPLCYEAPTAAGLKRRRSASSSLHNPATRTSRGARQQADKDELPQHPQKARKTPFRSASAKDSSASGDTDRDYSFHAPQARRIQKAHFRCSGYPSDEGHRQFYGSSSQGPPH